MTYKFLQFKTESGSVYNVDAENKKICRLSGIQKSTIRQGKDGNWKEYELISPIKVGEVVAIGWKINTDFGICETTMTSKVIGLEDIFLS